MMASPLYVRVPRWNTNVMMAMWQLQEIVSEDVCWMVRLVEILYDVFKDVHKGGHI